jgi:hypothetical protein
MVHNNDIENFDFVLKVKLRLQGAGSEKLAKALARTIGLLWKRK